MSDPSIGRFWQIDPLAEDYVYNSPYAFQENKLGIGIELEGAEVLGWDLAQDLVMRGASFFDGAYKVVTGSGNMLNEAMSGKTAERMARNSQAGDNQATEIDTNLEMVLDGGSQMDEALPDKQDVRDAADATELIGDVMVVGGIASTPVTGPGGLATAGVGGTISNIGLGVNILLDVSEGDWKGFSQRVGVETVSFGFGSFVKQSGGDVIVEKLRKKSREGVVKK